VRKIRCLHQCHHRPQAEAGLPPHRLLLREV
jgi:hypothetical protein